MASAGWRAAQSPGLSVKAVAGAHHQPGDQEARLTVLEALVCRLGVPSCPPALVWRSLLTRSRQTS